MSAIWTATLPGFNTRETAFAIWAVGFFAVMLVRGDVRESTFAVFRTLFTARILVIVFSVVAVYTTVAAFALSHGLPWSSEATKTVVFWYFATAIAALSHTEAVDGGFFRRLLVKNITVAAIIEFVVNLYTLPLPVELITTPVVAVIGVLIGISGTKSEFARVGKLLTGCAGIIGITYFMVSLFFTAFHFHETLNPEKISVFVIPFILTLVFLPLLYLVKLYATMQDILVMTKLGFRNAPGLYSFARAEILRSCGLSLARAQFFQDHFRGQLWGLTDEAEVHKLIAEFKDAWLLRKAGDGSERTTSSENAP